MSSTLRTSLLAMVCALLGATGVQATPDPAALSTASADLLAHATAGENGNHGGLARWPGLCPLVSGVTREQGERVLERVSEIAQEAGIPLAGEKCRPNLYILFTSDPVRLLRGMEQKNRAFTFSCGIREPGPGTPPDVVDDFIRTPRHVRTWYNTTVTTPDGVSLCTDRRAVERHVEASNLQYATHWNLLTAFAVIDTTRLAGITQAQLTDYIAMVSLVRMNPDVPLQNAQTILRLFAGAPGAAPAGMTVWDRALLRAIYSDSGRSVLQRRQLARRMIADVAQR